MPTFFLTLHSYADWGVLLLRIILGAIFWVHGRSKINMWKMQPTPEMPASMISIMRLLSICEPLGAIAVVTGFLTQLAALGFCIIMCGAIYSKIVAWKMPFMAHDKTGWELDAIVFASSSLLFFVGAGSLGLDRLIFDI
jgi:uncharacterized membrane protein YphA (DoxX/SURF4 family)